MPVVLFLQAAYEYVRLYCFWLCVYASARPWIHMVSVRYLENALNDQPDFFACIGVNERKVPFDNQLHRKFKMAAMAAITILVCAQYLTNTCSDWPDFFVCIGVNEREVPFNIQCCQKFKMAATAGISILVSAQYCDKFLWQLNQIFFCALGYTKGKIPFIWHSRYCSLLGISMLCPCPSPTFAHAGCCSLRLMCLFEGCTPVD